jgi:cytochrome c biogenesis factor
MHHVKSLDAFDRLLHRVYGVWGRHNGSFQLVWCTELPVLIAQIELLHEVIGAECTINKDCVIDMHHVKSLDAFDRLLHRVYGVWGRHNGSFQLVWCSELSFNTLLPVALVSVSFGFVLMQ